MRTKTVYIFIMSTLVVSSLFGCGCSNSADTSVRTNNEVVSSDSLSSLENLVEDNSDNQVAESPVDNQDTDGGGNEFSTSSDGEILEYDVLVSEDKYYYNNAPIVLDDFIDIISNEDCDVVVYIADDNATLNSYEALVKRLDELDIKHFDK